VIHITVITRSHARARAHTHTHMGRDSVVSVATRYAWTVRGSDPGRDEFSAPVQTVPGAHVDSYTGTVSFSGVKRSGRGVIHPLHLVLRLNKE
jgi:hypothetical protein